MKYLVILDDEMATKEDATSAVLYAGVPKWDAAKPAALLRTLLPGDSLTINRDVTILVTTGSEYQA